MKSQNTNLSSYDVQEYLLKNPTIFSDPKGLVECLFKLNRVEYVSAVQFCKRLQNKLRDYSSQMIKLFVNSHNRECQNTNNYTLVYPWPITDDQTFELANLKLFVDEYFKAKNDQEFDEVEFKKDQQYKVISSIQDNTPHQQINQFQISSLENQQAKELPLQEKQIKGQLQTVNIYHFDNEEDMPFDCLLMKQKQQEIMQEQQEQYEHLKANNYSVEMIASHNQHIYLHQQDQNKQKKIPAYFLQKQKAIQSLLAVQLTHFYQKQLDQVKDTIRKQIKDRQSFLVLTYKQFLQYFANLYYIKQGKLDPSQNLDFFKNAIQNYFSQYLNTVNRMHYKIKYGYCQKKSPLILIWQPIYNKLIEKFEQVDGEKVVQIIQQALENIYLVMKGNNRIYGLTSNFKIFINVNENQNNYTLDEYRNGPLKPYILLTLYHQISHFLIRRLFEQVQTKNKRSFCFDEFSLGGKIIALASRQYQNIKKRLKVRLELYKSPEYIQTQIIGILHSIPQEVYCLASKYRDWLDIFRKNYQTLSIIKQQIESAYEIFLQIIEHKLKDKINKQWTQIYNYIDNLHNKEFQQQLQNIQMEQRYRFFFILFLDQKIVFSWINRRFPLDQYKRYRQKLQQINTSKYCIYRHNLIQKLTKKFTVMDIKRYLNLLDKKKGILQIINQRVIQYCRLFNQQQTYQLLRQLKEQEERAQRHLFHTVPSTQIQRKIEKLVSNSNHLLAISKIDESYNYLMSIIKYVDLLTVVCQLQICNYNGFQEYQAGTIIQHALFPNLHRTNIIHSKDFDLIKDIENELSRKSVGEIPQSNYSESKSISVYKSGSEEIKVEKFIKRGQCGMGGIQKQPKSKKE